MNRIFLHLVVAFVFAVGGLLYAQSEDSFDILQNREGGITITGYTGSQKQVVIPERISGIPVTAIGKESFSGQGLVQVTIPRSVTMMDEGAFADNNLTSLAIPEGVTVIWHRAFANNRIAAITFPRSLIRLGNYVFSGNNLTTVDLSVLPPSIDLLPEGTFLNNTLVSINFGPVSTIANLAIADVFRDAENTTITTIVIGGNVQMAAPGLERSFINFYNSQGKRAGTYTKNGRIWAVQ